MTIPMQFANPTRISVIVPAYNNSKDLTQCLSALMNSPCSGMEIIVVDDSSTEDTLSVASRMATRTYQLGKNSGPAAARNHGAHHAKGNVFFFVDADVVVATGAVSRVLKAFDEQPSVAALFGSYDAHPRATGLVSQYRNLLHHFVHQNGNQEASTFWAGCGAVRRSVFEEVGGFDEKRFAKPSIEDIELGHRIRQAGHRILLDRNLQGTHLKRWTLRSLIVTDITCRAIPWSRLILASKQIPNDLNLRWDQRVSFILVALALLFLAMGVFESGFIAYALLALSGMVFLNRDLYGFFYRQRGLLFSLACLPLHTLYFLYSGLGFLYVRAELWLKRISPNAPAHAGE